MDAEILKELGTYWRLADWMIVRADKADVAEAARILALQAAAYTWRYENFSPPKLMSSLNSISWCTRRQLTVSVYPH